VEDHGYEPRPDGESIVLANCPFHRLAQQHADTVCNLNLELLRGVATGANDREHTLVLDPGVGRCCVRVVRRPQPPAQSAERPLGAGDRRGRRTLGRDGIS
jgi:predicted ArsR family transcriptional regulator